MLDKRWPLWRRILWLPGTQLGWWSVGLAAGFFVFLEVFFALLSSGQTGGPTFFSNLWLALAILTAAGFALAGGIAAAVAIFRKGERSILLFLALFLGIFVLVFATGEVADH